MVSDVWDYLSMLPIFYMGVLMIATWFHRIYGWILVGALGVSSLIEGFKLMTRSWLHKYTWLRRPDGATNCNCMNDNGDVSGTAGFPSGHVATMAFIVTCLVVLSTRNQSSVVMWSWVTYAIVTVTIVALARLKKKCHTPLQVVVGAIIGMLCGLIITRVASSFAHPS